MRGTTDAHLGKKKIHLAMGTMLLTAAATAFLMTCAATAGPNPQPLVGVDTMAGLIQHESGWHEYAIGDNTARRGYYPSNYLAAVQLTQTLLAEGHNLDAGLAQINTTNWRHYGLDAYTIFDPCLNVRTGAAILYSDYQNATAVFPSGDIALQRALSMYNSGTFDASLDYASFVMANARQVRYLSDSPNAHAAAVNTDASTREARTQALEVRGRVAAHALATKTVLSWALPSRSGSTP